MWTKRMSLRLSQVCVGVFLVALWVGTMLVTIGLSDFLRYAGGMFDTPRMMGICLTLLYAGAVTATGALTALHLLLRRITKEDVFSPGNVRLLRILSWLCFCAAGIFLMASLLDVHWVFLFGAASAAFMGLLLRVVKNAFAEAVELKNENDLTV